MIGYVAYREDVRTLTVEERNLLGLRFLYLALPRGRRILGKHYAGRAARALGAEYAGGLDAEPAK